MKIVIKDLSKTCHVMNKIVVKDLHVIENRRQRLACHEKRGLNRASKPDKFLKENEGITPRAPHNEASCGKKLLRIQGQFSESLSTMT